MITISATLNVGKSGGAIESVTCNNRNNISPKIENVLGKRNVEIGNPFILGLSELGSGAYYADSLPYFMGSVLSDNNGNFSTPYTITFTGEKLESVIIVFDKENGRFPRAISIDGETQVDDDATFEIHFKGDSDTHSVIISNWNTPNSPFVVTSIYSDINIEINKNNLLSFTSDIIDTSGIDYPSYGVVSNSANLTILDKGGQLLDLIQYGILHSNVDCSVYLNNTDNGRQSQICNMKIRELSYDSDNRSVDISLKDNLEEMQEYSVEPIYYDFDNEESKPAKYFYDYLYEKTVDIGFTFETLDDETLSVLENTVIQYPILEKGNLWEEWDKLCNLCFLYMFINREGKITVKYSKD